ncbi:acyltransferase family protein [Streptomyces sp. NPDC059002]|uniref:acyltransferase family protein n=1 Tax=Streptomyces sp. NPDC059002 TaxID=3346690 RepID=UPI003692BC3A
MSQTRAARRPSTLPSLTGMRFLAALLVFLSHLSAAWMFTDQRINDDLTTYLGTLGYLGVSFFFILSGFVLTWSARDGDRAPLFWRRRLVKIYPNHCVTWIGGLALALLAGSAVSGREFLPGLFLVNAWVPEYAVVRGVNGPAWSLCVELVFYLCFPALLALVKKIRPQHLWGWFGAVALGTVAVAALADALLPQQDLPGLPYGWYQFWAVYFLPVTRLLEFVAGILLARIVLSGRRIPVSRTVAALTLIPGYLLTIHLPGSYGLVSACFLPMCLIVVTGAQGDIAGTPGPMGGRVMVWLGEISFAFYMVHMIVAYHGPVDHGSGNQWGTGEAVLRACAWFALTLVFAWLLHRFVEVPAMRRWSRPKNRGRATAAVPVQLSPMSPPPTQTPVRTSESTIN